MVSDAHPGLQRAIAEVFLGASWQRCRVHFLRDLLSRVPKSAQATVAATVRPIFQQQSREQAQAQLSQVCTLLRPRFPKAVELLEAAEEEILAFYDFPPEHWRQIYSTNPLERLSKELKRRSAVVGIARQAAHSPAASLIATASQTALSSGASASSASSEPYWPNRTTSGWSLATTPSQTALSSDASTAKRQ